ncbi:MAG: selenoneine synthase SenA [Planctomycetota bacterium]
MTATKPTNEVLAQWVSDARARTLALVADLSDAQLIGPRLEIVNPLLWEIGHVAWFQEWWVLRHSLGQPPILEDGDALYDSARVAHATRWDLPLHSRADTIAYLLAVRDRVLARLAGPPLTPPLGYFVMLALYHEDMHDEAFTYTRQTHGYPAPTHATLPRVAGQDPAGRDIEIPGAMLALGSTPDQPFVFDNEKWQHRVEVAPFRIARDVVTQGEFAVFVDAGGYAGRQWWSEAGWRWRERARAEHPLHWRRDGRAWARRCFDQWLPLEPDLPVIHVNWYEAEAYCRFAGRRLPTEAEWELAASGAADGGKRNYPWGDAWPDATRAHLDGASVQCVPASALPAGDSAFGCRQMIGNVWQWVQDDFLPYPGFAADPYQEYSRPWFGTHKVLRGGSFVTRARLIHNRWRNFYTPDRRDVWAGLRTCARDA